MTLISLNDDRYISHDQVAWDLKKPCADCPFRRDAPHHLGVANSIPEYVEMIEAGRFCHTCHKTDNRPLCDGPRNHSGLVQHCAGALHFLIRAGLDLQRPLAQAIDAGKVDVQQLVRRAKRDSGVFGSLKEMLSYYLAMLEREQRLRREDPQVCVVFLDHTVGDPPTMMRLSEARAMGERTGIDLSVSEFEILTCQKCGAPASHYDNHWPYQEANYCHEHAGDRLNETAADYQALIGEAT